MLLVQVCEKLWSEFSAYEGLRVIEMGVESRSKGMYACGGEGMGGCRNVYGCGSLVATYETNCCRREGSSKW